MRSIVKSDLDTDQVLVTAAVDGETGPASKTAEDLYRELAAFLHSRGMRILHERVFGPLDFYDQFVKIRKQCLGAEKDPFSYIEGRPCRGVGLAGIQVHAVRPVAGEDFRIIRDGERPCGRLWKRHDATYAYLSGITGSGQAGGRRDWTREQFKKINRLLAAHNLDFNCVVRTWVFLEDILDWYDTFNKVRTNTFMELGLIPGKLEDSEIDALYLPASTGISGRNISGAPGLFDVLAISGDLKTKVLPGVNQRSAFRYGSAFSRGVSIQGKGFRQIFVSGTAAIDDRGYSLHAGNTEAQITRTIENVRTLIAKEGASLNDIRCATVFLKRPEDINIFEKVAGRFQMQHLPAVCVTADICRPELLFEMDALAVVH